MPPQPKLVRTLEQFRDVVDVSDAMLLLDVACDALARFSNIQESYAIRQIITRLEREQD